VYRFDLGASAWTWRSVRGPDRRLFRFEAFFFDVLAFILVSIAILIVLPLLETKILAALSERYRMFSKLNYHIFNRLYELTEFA
jgi:hypothetical protein